MMFFNPGRYNKRPFLSSIVPLFQSESKGENETACKTHLHNERFRT